MERVELVSNFENSKLLPLMANQILEKYKITETSNEKKVLCYIYAKVQSLILRFNYEQEAVLIVNFQKYLELTITEINKWESYEKQDIRSSYKINYENNLKIKMEEGKKFISSLQEELENEEGKMNENIKKILEKVSEMKSETKSNDKKYVDKKGELENEFSQTLKTKKYLGALKIGCSLLSFLGPKGQIAGGIIQTGIEIGANFADAHGDKLVLSKPKSSDPNLDKVFSDYKSHLKNQNSNELSKMEEEVKLLENYNKIEKNSFQPNDKATLKPLDERITSLPDSKNKYDIQFKFADYMIESTKPSSEEKNKYKQMREEAKAKYEVKNKNIDKTNQYLEDTSKTLKAVKVISEVYKDVSDTQRIGNEQIKRITEEMEKNAGYYQTLDKMEKSFNEFQNGMFKQVRNEINDFAEGLNSKSSLHLDLSKYEITKKLDDLRGGMIDVMDKIGDNLKLTNSINRMEQAFKTMIDIYKGIEAFKQQIEFTNLIADLTRTELQVGIPNEYQAEINSLKKSIQKNIIKEKYQKAVEAYKYYSFPFYCEKMEDLKLVSSNDENSNESSRDLILQFSDTLNRMYSEIKNEEAEITYKDNYLQYLDFENDLSFYEWSSNDFPFEITQLLSGNKTVLYSGVKKTFYDALKFCTIYLKVKIKFNETVNEKLNALLNKNVLVELTHSGISNYKFKESFHVINLHFKSNHNLILSYQYGTTSVNNANEAYKKLRSNKPILSPYTFWEIQLKPIRKNNFNIFNEISSIIEDQKEIIVSMHGIGKYVKDEYNLKSKNCKNKRDLSKKLTNKCSNRDNYRMVRKVF